MRRVLADERGFALPIALLVMVIGVALSAAAVLAASNQSGFSNRDTNDKAALEAADAGVRAASYRLNMFLPQAGYCPTNPSTTVGGSGLCAQDGPESLGNGTSFSYWVSDVLTVGQSCAGVPVTITSTSLNPQAVSQRCVTAYGTAGTGVHQVSARVQVRVASYTAQALFAVPGLIGLNELTVRNNAIVNGTGGSNGPVTVSNNASLTGTVVGPNGSVSVGNNGTAGTITHLTAAQGPIGLPLPSFGNSATVNSDARIGAAGSTTLNCKPSPGVGATVDACSGLSWSDTAGATRQVNLSNNASLTLSGGVYNFCNFTTKNNVTIKIPAGVYTTIYIDSPSDPNSGCAAGSGTFTLGNNASVQVQTMDPANPGHADPTALKIFVYGNPSSPGTNTVTWSNNTETDATVVAPFSSVELSNNGAWFGAAGGYNLDMLNNFTFNWYGKESSLYTGQQDIYYRTAWEQCPAIGFNASTPTAGC